MANENILDSIIAKKRETVAASKAQIPLTELKQAAQDALPVRDFYGALASKNKAKQTALICEIKKASPSAGLIRAEFHPAEIAKIYEDAGASCLSILTDNPFFQGCPQDLIAARAACALPVLRKDFMIDTYQVTEARAMGADCILIIMACSDDSLVRELAETAAHYGMSILVEIHDEEELARFENLNLITPKTMLGINNRNLKTLTIDLATTEILAAKANKKWLCVGESGIKTHENIIDLEQAGVTCFLVGENLLKSNNIFETTKLLLGK